MFSLRQLASLTENWLKAFSFLKTALAPRRLSCDREPGQFAGLTQPIDWTNCAN
jgi:hypothetical protein